MRAALKLGQMLLAVPFLAVLSWPQANSMPQLDAPLQVAPHVPLSQTECADFYSHRVYHHVLRVVGGYGEEHMAEFTAGDKVFLVHAAGMQPGEEFRLLRIVKQKAESPQFKHQADDLERMGLYFRTLGQAQVLKVENGTATARLEFTCSPIQFGDFGIPWVPRVQLAQPKNMSIDLLQPIAPFGLLVSTRHMQSEVGVGDEVFVNLGARAGMKPGQELLVVRGPESPSSKMMGGSVSDQFATTTEPGLDLHQLRKYPHPYRIVGLLEIDLVQNDASSAQVLYSNTLLMPGDEVAPAAPLHPTPVPPRVTPPLVVSSTAGQ